MKILRTKVFKTLVSIFIVGLLLGIVVYIISDKSDNYIINYFNLFKQDTFNYMGGLYNTAYNSYKYAFFIWILGFIPILSFIILFVVIFRGISLGFVISSIICSFGIKGVILSLILLFTAVINEMVFLLLGYYGINMSYKIFNIIKDNKQINIRSFFKNYFFIYSIFLLILLSSSLIETYISSNIIKYVI